MEFNEDINMELVSEVSKVLEKYSSKDVIISLWYMLLTINMTILNQIDKKDNQKQEQKKESQETEL